MKRIYIPKKEAKHPNVQTIAIGVFCFLLGCMMTASVVLHVKVASVDLHPLEQRGPQPLARTATASDPRTLTKRQQQQQQQSSNNNNNNILSGKNILVVIVAFDFSQIPHLEEVLDAYHDVCVAATGGTAGGRVDVIIHATVAYPVTLLDLWNTRFTCPNFSITIALKPKSLRLHLVDCHRALFYEKINEYDLFIYTEDDIRITPSIVATYLSETQKIENLLKDSKTDYKPSDFNVGIVRYEYNFPANVVIDDKTRHATQNVTRVYWEHSGFQRPVVPNALYTVKQKPLSQNGYVTMKNHHQGMFLATRDLLLAWKERRKCRFHQARNRPGVGNQPTEGTQRVWMSSQMLYGPRHCGVQQVFPINKFGALTALHLPNKNYRRVGRYRNRTFSDGTEVFQPPHPSLLTAMELHLGMRQALPQEPQIPYRGIRMIDEVDKAGDRTPLLERRMAEYQAYVDRGGILSDEDMTKTVLVEDK